MAMRPIAAAASVGQKCQHAVRAERDEARRECPGGEREAPTPDRERRPRLAEAAAEEPVVQVSLIGDEDLLAVLQPARDDERRVDDRDREHEQREEQRDRGRSLQQALTEIVASTKPSRSAPESPMKIRAG